MCARHDLCVLDLQGTARTSESSAAALVVPSPRGVSAASERGRGGGPAANRLLRGRATVTPCCNAGASPLHRRCITVTSPLRCNGRRTGERTP